MNQKGFIPLLIIVIALIVLTSAGTGIVLHVQGKLSLFIINVAEIFQGAKENALTGDVTIQQTDNTNAQAEEAQNKVEQAELEAKNLKQQATIAQDEIEKARLLAEAEKAKAEAEIAKLEVERLRKEIAEQKLIPLSITKISPDQILNNIDNKLTIYGFGIQEGIGVKIGNVDFGVGNVIDDKTIAINISQGALEFGIYNIEITNPNGETAILYNAFKVAEPQISVPVKLTTEEISVKVSPAVVQIRNDSVSGYLKTGSGVIIDSTGYILTNEHVVQGDIIVDVKLNNGTIVNGLVVGWNRVYDLAVVKLTGNNFPYVDLGNSNDVVLGQEVVALGYPLSDFSSSITVLDGIITKKGESGSIPYFQTSASIQPGSSGGALVNKNGEIIGINSWCRMESGICITGWGGAIEINTVESILSNLKAGLQISFGISNIQVPEIGPNSATINWATVYPATSQVWYGMTSNLGSYTPLYTSLISSHSVNLSGLSPNTKYYFKVVSEDLNGSREISSRQSFFIP